MKIFQTPEYIIRKIKKQLPYLDTYRRDFYSVSAWDDGEYVNLHGFYTEDQAEAAGQSVEQQHIQAVIFKDV